MSGIRKGVPRESAVRKGVPRENAVRKDVCRESGIRASVPAVNAPRETEIRLNGTRQTGPGETGARVNVLREIVSRAGEIREKAVRTEPQGAVARAVIPRGRRTAVITAAATAAVMAAPTAAARAEAREAGRTEDSSSQEEADRMEGPRETDRADFREAAGRVLWVLQVTAGVRALVRVLGAISMVVRATAEALEGREVDSVTINRARVLFRKLRARIWRRSARKTREGLTARRKESAPGKTISTRRMRQPGRSPAGSSSLKRRKRKWQRKSSR